MTLAYIFWHTPAEEVSIDAYEDGLRTFHARLDGPSASFRLAGLPFASRAGYEDWYLVDGWSGLGDLNTAAVSGPRRDPHDAVAMLSEHGWGGVFLLLRGAPEPPRVARWTEKPRGNEYTAFVESLGVAGIWQRQMVLGPAPEFCLVDAPDEASRGADPGRTAVVYRA